MRSIESILASAEIPGQTLGNHLSRHAVIRRILTGKPTAQGPHDLWAQMRAIGQLDGRNFYAFRGAFCRLGGFKNKQVVGSQNEDMLAQLLNPSRIVQTPRGDWLFQVCQSLHHPRTKATAQNSALNIEERMGAGNSCCGETGTRCSTSERGEITAKMPDRLAP